MLIIPPALLLYASGLFLVWNLENPTLRRQISRLIPPLALLALLPIGPFLSPAARLLLSTVLMLGLIKCAAALRRPRAEIRAFSRLGLALYFSIWPGIDLTPFQLRRDLKFSDTERHQDANALFRGATFLVFGFVAFAALAWNAPHLNRDFLGWATIAALLSMVHFGFGEMLPYFVHQLGFRVGKLFDFPLASANLSEFWSRRWNVPFVEMDRILFLRPLRKLFGARGAIIGVFAISGIFHEAGISYPAGAGWGGPLLYFLLHGALVILVAPRLKNPLAARLLAWIAILAPLPLLFHAPFRETLILPLVFWASKTAHQQTFDWYLNLALWLGSLAHFCILGASFQVPKQLGWVEDFASLSRFNRKIFWTYGGFIVLCIVSLGVLSAVLHQELLRGDRAAVAISIFIGVFWTTRVLTDLLYFKHDDWPRGAQFEVGHVFLTFAFSALATLFGLVVPLCALR